ncbi:MAG: enoyl-CoA hydratase [Deltaproteobacteria bacterium]|nr:enoyl-CoA hydratase [Deltaproteobacteria bacterium]
MSELIRIETADRVTTITFARSEKKNALTPAMYEAVATALRQADQSSACRVVVVRGEDGVFTAGNDLGSFLQEPPKDTDTPVFRFLQAISGFGKPVIAAVDGHAVGVGTTMLLHCDLVYASPRAKFRLPFVDLAVPPEAASSYLLPRLVGPQRAAELLFFAEAFDARTAYQLGIVNQIVDAETLYQHAAERAAKLAAKPPGALQICKQLLRAGTAELVAETMLSEGELFVERLTSPEAIEAFTAFMQKRAPDFSKF